MNTSRQGFGRRGAGRRRGNGVLDTLPLLPLALVAVGVGGGLTTMLDRSGLSDWLLGARQSAAPAASQLHSGQFGFCSGSVRVTCVVDGDTFWLDGTKIRIADINTPEISSPQCSQEAVLGRRATERLRELLNAGPFALVRDGRDEDQYGRKLRVAMRDGSSLGGQLVAEGLAHEWQGYRRGWC